MKKIFAFIILTACMAGPGKTAWAAENFKPSPWVTTRPYFEQTGHKLGFGILNLTSGWLAFFYESTRGNFFSGLGRGIWRTIAYTGGGAIHAVTFPIPVDLPLPQGGIQFRS